ncbi:hypothetical protein ACQP2U_19900 [Nocardia sp. CA-084685]|uniref:hypothetical protein n=1 Tax=Nocardia sp. CA-084685 TaxID=3239970 RepID=UPI003D97DA72
MLRATIPLGRVAGIRIGAHWSALVTLGLFAFLLGRSLSEIHGNSAGPCWLPRSAPSGVDLPAEP